jgi:preprotein translocase subunit SecA
VKTLTRDALLCDLPDREDPTKGLDALMDGAGGSLQRRGTRARRLRAEAEAVDRLAPEWSRLNDNQLHERLRTLREEFRRAGRREAILPGALAAVREVAGRRLGERPYLVQVMGALALHRGWLAEMATGEGKTLTAGVAAVLTAWTGVPLHLITVNDYLAERDAGWMAPLFSFCGLSVGFVTGEMDPVERRRNYACDVVYTTSKEIAADFLRDRLLLGQFTDVARWRVHQRFRLKGDLPNGVVMRGLHSAIVDEADSVLVDEAVTPLIISGKGEEAAMRELHGKVAAVAEALEPRTDYHVNTRYKEIELQPPGRRKVAAAAENWGHRWRNDVHASELVEQALVARIFFQRDKHYVVREGQVVIVDEYTGRLMPNRKWRHGLHQAIEHKEGIEISAPDTTLARLSFQRFYRLFRHLGGMTGTAWEVRRELWHIYRLPVVRIPTNRPVRRRQLPDRHFVTSEEKWRAIVRAVGEMHATGRPVLVGTRSVAASEELAARLRREGITFALLNAVQDGEEARIVAEAGIAGRVTIATNMAGRGTDIRLGEGVVERGGLHVISTERHDSLRVDRQLFGRAGRQGDPGSAQAFVSLEDELLLRHAWKPLLKLTRGLLQQGWPGAAWWARRVVAEARGTAEKQARKARTQVLNMDTWLDDATGFSGRRVG